MSKLASRRFRGTHCAQKKYTVTMAGETGGERGEGLPPGPRNGKMMGGMGGNQPFIKRALFTDFAFLLPFLRGKLRVQWGPFRTGKGSLSAQRAL